MTNDIASLVKQHCIALTGGIASGKSTVAAFIRKHGFTVFDADVFAHEVVKAGSPGLAAIQQAFSSTDILLPDGTLNRAAMKNLISHDPAAKSRLDQIMHPLIRNEFLRQIKESGLIETPRTFFYEATLIHETGRGGDFKATWCVYCPRKTQLERLVSRSGERLSSEDAQALIDIQMPTDEKAKLSDVVIDTSSSLHSVESQLKSLLALQ